MQGILESHVAGGLRTEEQLHPQLTVGNVDMRERENCEASCHIIVSVCTPWVCACNGEGGRGMEDVKVPYNLELLRGRSTVLSTPQVL